MAPLLLVSSLTHSSSFLPWGLALLGEYRGDMQAFPCKSLSKNTPPGLPSTTIQPLPPLPTEWAVQSQTQFPQLDSTCFKHHIKLSCYTDFSDFSWGRCSTAGGWSFSLGHSPSNDLICPKISMIFQKLFKRKNRKNHDGDWIKVTTFPSQRKNWETCSQGPLH